MNSIARLLGHRQRSYYYARIDSKSTCLSVWAFDGKIDRPDAIQVAEMDTQLIGKVWTGQQWVEPRGI